MASEDQVEVEGEGSSDTQTLLTEVLHELRELVHVTKEGTAATEQAGELVAEETAARRSSVRWTRALVVVVAVALLAVGAWELDRRTVSCQSRTEAREDIRAYGVSIAEELSTPATRERNMATVARIGEETIPDPEC